MLTVVPVPGQSLGSSRDLISGNFGVIDAAFSVNHVPYNDGAGLQGIHNFVTFPSTHLLYPLLPTTVAQVGLYSSTGPISGNPELFFQRANQAANTGYTFTEAGSTNPGWTRLPSGILLKWGSGISFVGTSSTVNLNAGIGPNFTATLTILITPISTVAYNQVISISNITFPNFTVSTNNGSAAPGTTKFSYLAIGI